MAARGLFSEAESQFLEMMMVMIVQCSECISATELDL